MRITPEEMKAEDFSVIKIFVYGSNESGINSAGAALFAKNELGAKSGLGFGRSNFCFAIPTKDWDIKTLPLSVINFYVNRFIAYAAKCSKVSFYVTQIGCGLAGYAPKDIAPMFRDAMDLENVYLPQSFWDVLIPDLSEYFQEGLPSEKQKAIVEYLLDVVREQTPHGKHGVTEISRVVTINGERCDITLKNIQWGRHDKQYYFIDNYDPPKLTITKLY